MINYSSGLVGRILSDGGSDWSFEQFCCRHFTEVEGIEYFHTSRNYDLARDGRATTELMSGRAFIIASRQERNLLKKAYNDMKKLAQHELRISRVAICFTGVRSEKERDEIERKVSKIRTGATIRVYGLTELVERCQRFSAAFEDCFKHELDDARREVQFRDDDQVDARRVGFRVMLATLLNKESTQLRGEILKRLVLQSLPASGSISWEELSRRLGEAVGASRPIHPSYLTDVRDSLMEQQLIRLRDREAYLTETGLEQSRAYDELALEAVLDGRFCLRKSLARHVENLSDRDFGLIWETVKTGIIDLFQIYGVEVVSFVERISEDAKIEPHSGMPETVYNGLQRIVGSLDTLSPQITLSKHQHRKLVDNFLIAVFDPDSGMRQWLSQLCGAYVCACTLGLHPDALKRLEAAVRNWDIFPDSHVLLSLLGFGEADHESIRQLLAWWSGAQGSLLTCEPYAEEVVRHAKLAEAAVDRFDREWSKTRSRRRALPPDGNVFLRSAIARHGEQVSPRAIRSHVQQVHYPGSGATDKLKGILREHGLKEPPPVLVDAELERKLFLEFCAVRLDDNLRSELARQNIRARCSADAKALAFIAAFRATIKHTSRSAIVLTQSDCLRRIAAKFQPHFSLQSVCVDPSRLIFTLSLMPGATLSITVIEAALFGNVFEWERRRHERLAKRLQKELASDDPYEYSATLEDRAMRLLQGGH